MLNPKVASYLFINIKISWITREKRVAKSFLFKGEKLNRFSYKKKKNGNKGEQKKTNKDSTFVEGVLEEKNTARKEEDYQDSLVTELNQDFHSL